MKILLVGNLPRDKQKSMLVFGDMMRRELEARGHEVRLLQPQTHVGGMTQDRRLGKWLDYIDKFLLFPRQLRQAAKWADVVHVCDHSNAMYARRRLGRPVLVTCHDVIAIQAALGLVPDWDVSATGRVFQWLIRRGLGRADMVCCVSRRTRDDLLELGIALEDRVRIVWNGLNDEFGPVDAGEARALLAPLGVRPDDDYLIHVGTDLARKNRFTVLRTFAQLVRDERARGQWPALKLVFVGPPLNPAMHEFAQAEGLLERIVIVRNIDAPQLRALYANAIALLFPSTSEGFGWPIIEAQACGCLAVVADLSPMNEIAGEPGLRAAPEDHVSMARQLAASIPRLDELSRLSIANAARFSCAAMIDGYLKAYDELLKGAR